MGFQERFPNLEEPTPTVGVGLALSLFYVSTALFHPVLDCTVLGDSATKMQWAEVFREELMTSACQSAPTLII